MSPLPIPGRRTRSAAVRGLLFVALIAIAVGVGPAVASSSPAVASGSPTTAGVAPVPADVAAPQGEPAVSQGGPAAVQADGESAAVEVSASDFGERTVWIGQQVRITGFVGGETVELSAGDASGQRSADQNGTLLVDTGGFEAREYRVEGAESGAGGTLDVREQTLTASFDPEVTDGGATLAVRSSREDYEVALATDGASPSAFGAGFDAGRVEDGRYVLPVDGTSDAFDVDTTEWPLDGDEYEFDVRATDADAAASANLTVQKIYTGIRLASSESRTGAVGDAFEFSLSTASVYSETVAVTLRDARDRYRAVATLEVPENRSSVELRWNTHRALGDDAGLSVDGGHVTDVNVSGYYFGDDRAHLEGDVEHEFDLGLYSNRHDVEDRLWDDRASITLERRTVDELTVRRAPAAAEPPANASELADVLAAGSNEATDVVSTQDLLLVEARASGSFAFLDGTPASFADAGLALNLAGPTDDSSDPIRANVSDAALADDASAVPAPDGDGFVVAVEADAIANLANASSSSANASQTPNATLGDWTATLSVGPGYPYPDDAPEELTTSFRLVEPSIEPQWTLEGGRVVLPPIDESPFEAEANVANGTDVEVRVVGPDARHLFQAEVVDGTVESTLDLSGYDSGDRLSTVAVSTPESGLSTAREGVVAPFERPAGFASFAVEANAPANASAGSEATLHASVANRGTAAAEETVVVRVGGETRSEQPIELAPGETWNGTYEVDVADESTNWTVLTPHDQVGGAIEATGSGESGNRTGPDGSAPAADGDATPGFGAAAALVALLAGSLVASNGRRG